MYFSQADLQSWKCFCASIFLLNDHQCNVPFWAISPHCSRVMKQQENKATLFYVLLFTSPKNYDGKKLKIVPR